MTISIFCFQGKALSPVDVGTWWFLTDGRCRWHCWSVCVLVRVLNCQSCPAAVVGFQFWPVHESRTREFSPWLNPGRPMGPAHSQAFATWVYAKGYSHSCSNSDFNADSSANTDSTIVIFNPLATLSIFVQTPHRKSNVQFAWKRSLLWFWSKSPTNACKYDSQ